MVNLSKRLGRQKWKRCFQRKNNAHNITSFPTITLFKMRTIKVEDVPDLVLKQDYDKLHIIIKDDIVEFEVFVDRCGNSFTMDKKDLKRLLK